VTRGQGDRETGGRGGKEPSDDRRLPECAYRYFWDVDPVTLDVSKYPRYVIERLLEYGDLPSVRWMERRFSREEIVEVLKTSRALSRKSANFWLKILSVPREEVRCMSREFQQEYRQVWNW
jgi:hypothetical protein